MSNLKEKLKSPVVWAVIVVQICGIITLFSPEVSEQIKVIATAIIEVLTIFGVLNNPNNKGGF